MDPRRFDELTRVFARTSSRRQGLRAAVAGAVAGMLGRSRSAMFPSGGVANAAPVAALTCSSSNTFTSSCEQILDYQKQCGVICPNGIRKAGKSGCTNPNITEDPFVPGEPFSEGKGSKGNKGNKEECISVLVTRHWRADPKIAVLSWTSSVPTCCSDVCEGEVAKSIATVRAHEDAHVAAVTHVVNDLNITWTNRKISGCGKNRKEQLAALEIALKAANGEITTLLTNPRDRCRRYTEVGYGLTRPGRIPQFRDSSHCEYCGEN